jgi:uncharacterized membrane protein YobD (UPF0266 family)
MNTYIVYIKYQELKAHYVSESKVLVNAEDGDGAMDVARDLFKRNRLDYMTFYKIIQVHYVQIFPPCMISA